ncbi:MAG: ABC transporter ATP-binding protein/permease [Lachnospiraceae bacterium]|nr:ABC transporter ATP-binding protein/permease [Lachnospiraceae bacterium]
MNVYRRLKTLLDKKQKRQFFGLLILIFISALLETVGVSVILPIVSAVVTPETLLSNEVVRSVMGYCGIAGDDNDSFVKLLLIFAIAVYVFKNLFMLYLYYAQSGYVTKLESRTSQRLLGDYLNRPYEFYLNADVNAIFQTINKDIPHVFILLQEVMMLLTEAAVAVCLCGFLILVDFKMTIFIAIVMIILVGIIIFFIKPKLGKLGQMRVAQQVRTMKWMQQGIFGIKDVKVAAKEGHFLSAFSDAYDKLAYANRRFTVFNNTPRLAIEAFCMVGALGYMYLCVIRGRDMKGMFPMLSAFAMAAARLMPSVNRISTHMSSIAYYEPSLNYVCDNLDISGLRDEVNVIREKENERSLKPEKEIEIKDITYRYPNTEKAIFEDASMNIPVGKSVGVIGPSGAGKTTVIDILLGLLVPEKGKVLADGKDIRDNMTGWLNNTGYIAQNIYMLDTSIRDNVAFGIKEADDDRIWEVLKEAQMDEFVKSLPEGLDTVIGDRGVRISGGQRQRIGIARALYNDPELLVFDEATSALDNDTEAAIMDAINSLKGRKTLVIIAHRLKTVENCDILYRVENGKINKTSL